MQPEYSDWQDGTRVLWLREPEQAALLARDDVQFDLLNLTGGFESFEHLVPYAHRVRALFSSDAIAVDGLAKLTALEWLRETNLKFDFRRLPNLRRFESRDASVVPAKFLNHAAIEQLDVAECRIETLALLNDMTCLRQLRLVASKTTSLDGISRLTALRELRLHHARSLLDIAAVSACKELRVLCLEDTKKLADVSAIRELRHLQLLLVFDTQATLDDVNWLADMPSLRCAVLGATVAHIDWGIVASHPMLHEVVLRPSPDAATVTDEDIRQQCEAAGRVVTKIQRFQRHDDIWVQLEPRPGTEKPLSFPHYQHHLSLQKLPAP